MCCFLQRVFLGGDYCLCDAAPLESGIKNKDLGVGRVRDLDMKFLV